MNEMGGAGACIKVRIPTEEELIASLALLGRVKQKLDLMRKTLPLVPAEARPVDRKLADIYQDLLKLRILIGEY